MKRGSRAGLLTRGRGLTAGFRAVVARVRSRTGRAAIGGVQWGQLILVVACVGVGVGMVIVAETARASADRHRRAQVLVETIRAESQQLNAVRAQEMLDAVLASRDGTVHTTRGHVIVNSALLATGFASWRELSAALLQLRALEPDARTAHLETDAESLFTLGIQALAASTRKNLNEGIETGERAFAPRINRLNDDAQRASQYERRVADRSSSYAVTAFVLSLVLGLLALGVLTVSLQRLRRKNAIEAARRTFESRSEARLQALVEHSTDVVTVIGRDQLVTWQAPSLERVLGFQPEVLLGRRLSTIVHPDDVPLVERFLAAALERPGSRTINARFRHARGGWRQVEAVADNRLDDPAVVGVVLNMRDITERKALEDELRHQAFHDALTGLANRPLFQDRLSHAVALARRQDRGFAVLFLDLDDFKTINDSLGHARGDDLLRAVADRISAILRPSDTAARLGGDEFAMLVEIGDEERDALAIARRILDAIALPVPIAGRELRVTASIGVAAWSGAASVEDLLRNADTAMYAAKSDGKATARVFEPSMHRRVLERLELTGELRAAMESNEFELEYQPIVELESGEVSGVEALVRWRHPARARVTPNQFIGLAEETGLIVPLGLWILETACRQAHSWQSAFPGRRLRLSVNVSTRQLQEHDFVDAVSEVLERTGLPPDMLALEITESLLLGDRREVVRQLDGLRALGIRIAVDDFGTGYSSLSQLRHFPIDILKIDRSFVDGIEQDQGKEQLVRGIVNLGDSLQLDVIAEGIEDTEQLQLLREMQLPHAQGFLFHPPLAAAAITKLLARAERADSVPA
jgi:diguanylate cyclase (GGDEF)-like protein/PAS domain S-box-containing protein